MLREHKASSGNTQPNESDKGLLLEHGDVKELGHRGAGPPQWGSATTRVTNTKDVSKCQAASKTHVFVRSIYTQLNYTKYTITDPGVGL